MSLIRLAMVGITFLTASGHKIAINPKSSRSTFAIFQDGLIAEASLDEKDVSYEAYRRKRGYRGQTHSKIRIVRPIQKQLDRVDDALFAKLDKGLLFLAENPISPRSKPKCFRRLLGDLRLADSAHYSVVYTVDQAGYLRILRVRFAMWKPRRKETKFVPKLGKLLRQASTLSEGGVSIEVPRLRRTDYFVGYTAETADELFKYPAANQHAALVEGFREGIQKKAARKGELALTRQERIVLSVAALEQEVNNGGFDPFFRSSSRKFAPQIVASLRSIRCSRIAKIAERAIDALELSSVSVKRIESTMAKHSDKRDQKLEHCDQLLYKAQTQQDISKRYMLSSGQMRAAWTFESQF